MGGATRFLMLLATPFPPRTPSLLRLARHQHHYRRRPSSLPRGLSGSSHRLGSFRVNSSSSSQQLHSQAVTFRDDHFSESASPLAAGAQHPWPEWLGLLSNLSAGGYLRGEFGTAAPVIESEDEFAEGVYLQEDLLRAARACLAFAGDRPHLLAELPRNEVEIVVNNGTPFLFKNADGSVRRMRSFLNGGEVSHADKPQTVDLMRFILSYASYPMVDDAANSSNQELVASSVRILISELVKLTSSAAGTESVQNQFAGRYGQLARPRGQNIEMKRGDWICTRCNFMNFARNMKCLQCEEARPKRQLTGGEWDCPQCNFLNNGRNTACLRCDCRHPGGFSPIGSGYASANNADQADLERRLAANEEKAQRWFSKISQLDSTSDLNSAVADEDFPEIMPLRKGVNRFVVSTRKTPLERRLANPEYRRNSSSVGALPDSDYQTRDANGTAESPLSRRLDDVMGRKSDDKMNSGVRSDAATDSTPPYSNPPPQQQGYPRGNSSSYVPFVPLPPDMFAKKPENLATEDGKATGERMSSLSSNSKEQTSAAVNSPSNTSGDKDGQQEEKSDRWFKRIAELHDSQDLTTAIPDEDFPEIMPTPKGENRFVVSKKKDRSLTSPSYKRQAAMEQASNPSSNYVPFVPFPPDYFAKKEAEQSDVGNSIGKATNDVSSTSAEPRERKTEIPEVSSGNWSGRSSMGNTTNPVGNFEDFTRGFGGSQMSSNTTSTGEGTNTTTSSTQQPKSYSWSGKSLEGSAVKEPDPLDMSEEAKAERWFRRVAQIKDISELSQIPDEDFPSIMPMRKGVNRFVVSKRKTPLERRLTSAQHRRNLPVVSSDPIKKDDDSN